MDCLGSPVVKTQPRAGVWVLIPSQGAEIPYASQHCQNQFKCYINTHMLFLPAELPGWQSLTLEALCVVSPGLLTIALCGRCYQYCHQREEDAGRQRSCPTSPCYEEEQLGFELT